LRKAIALAAFVASLAVAPSAFAGGKAPVVFVQTNEATGNHVVVYDRAADGRLSRAGSDATGGNGGTAAPGTESDRLASQGSLVLDAGRSLLLGVNAGSDSIFAFKVQGDRLKPAGVLPSGGHFPASIAVHGDLVYVLNSGGEGIVAGFRIQGHKLSPIPGSARSLGLANGVPPFFLTSPGQVGFTPDGAKLIVTTKASTSSIDVFAVQPDGRLSAAPVVNPSATPVPFAFSFTPSGRLAAGEAGTSSVTTYAVQADGSLADAKSLSDGQVALCWIEPARGFYYVANTGSNTLSGYTIGADGQPSLIGTVATTEPGPIDLAASSDGSFLYGETGLTSTVDEYQVESDGTLTKLGTVTGLPPGIEGIAAS
jgi:Lactonase, 7-bladed beta-propeller